LLPIHDDQVEHGAADHLASEGSATTVYGMIGVLLSSLGPTTTATIDHLLSPLHQSRRDLSMETRVARDNGRLV